MAEKNKGFTSDVFGKYTQTPKETQKKAADIEKLTPGNWSPISSGSGRVDSEIRKPAPKTNRTAPQRQPITDKNRPISEGRAPSSQPKGNKTAGKKVGSTGNATRSTVGKPIGTAAKRQAVSKEYRKQGDINRVNARHDRHLSEGVAPGEVSGIRHEEKQKAIAKRYALLAGVFVVFVIILVLIYSFFNGALIEKINVEGESVYTSEEIIAATGIEPGVNMYSFSEKELNEILTKALPYIHSVELKRTLPDTITITVTATKEKYLIAGAEGYINVDTYGKVLSFENMKLEEGMYRIYGFEPEQAEAGTSYNPSDENTDRYNLVLSLVSAMEKEGVINGAVINVVNMDNVRVLYNGKVMIYLGSCHDIDKQISLASNVIKSSVSDDQTGYIDMRFSNVAYFHEGDMKLD